MPEAWASTPAGRHLSGRRKRDTGPEMALRRALHAAGYRFRLQRQIAKGCTPDIVLPGRRIAVFVDGCYWHNCPIHGRKRPWAGPNALLWVDKMAKNAERDARSTQRAAEHGWTVLRVWEHEVTQDVGEVVARVARATSGPR